MRLRQTADELIPDLARYQQRFLVAGAALGAVSLIGLFTDHAQFYRSYLLAYMYVLGATLGCLALGMIHVIIAEELYDRDFVAHWTHGFDEREQSAVALAWWRERIAFDIELDMRSLLRDHCRQRNDVIVANMTCIRTRICS